MILIFNLNNSNKKINNGINKGIFNLILIFNPNNSNKTINRINKKTLNLILIFNPNNSVALIKVNLMSIIPFKDHNHNNRTYLYNQINNFIKLIRYKILVYKILILDKQLISNKYNKTLPYKFLLYLLNKVKYNNQYINRILYNNLIKI